MTTQISKYLKRIALVALALVAAIATILSSYLLGWKSVGPSPSPQTLTPDQPSTPVQHPPAVEPTSQSASDLLERARTFLRFADRDQGFAQAVVIFADQDIARFPELLAHLADMPNTKSRRKLIEALVLNWANADPGGAFSAIKATLPKDDLFANLHTVFRLWSKADPDAALAGYVNDIRPMLDGDGYTGVEYNLSMIFRRIAADRFATALSEFHKLSGDEAKYALRGIAGAAGADLDNPDVLLSLLELSPEHQKTAFSDIAGSITSRQSPDEALRWLSSIPVSAEVSSEVESEIAGRWTWDQPAAAATWAAAHQSPDHLATVIGRWADWEPNAAGDWLRNIDPSSAHATHAYAAFALAVSTKDPESALAWTASIPQGERRSRTIRSLARQFSHRLVPGARTVIAASQLSDSEKATLLENAH